MKTTKPHVAFSAIRIKALISVICVAISMQVFAETHDAFVRQRIEFAKYYRQITGKDAPEGMVEFTIDPLVSKNGRDAYRIVSRKTGATGVSPVGGVSIAKIPIVGWSGLPPQMANAERYREAKDGGFTHLTQWCKTPAEAKRLLSEAERAGVKLIIGFAAHGTTGIKRMTDEAEAFVSAVKDSPALEYYYITDEPHINAAERIRDCVARYEALDPAHPCYVNLFGSSYDPGTRRDVERMRRNSGCTTYGEYLNRLYAVVPLKMLSFDVYPILSLKPIESADLRLHGARVFLGERWYETLEIASAFARERGIPLCAFALATAHRHYPVNNYPVPTKEHLRLQMYSNLAYGAQMLQYFRYHMDSPGRAPLASGGKRSPLFDLVREMNQEIQARAEVFLGAKVQGVWHTGLDIPLGTRRFDPKSLPPFVTSFSTPNEATAVVSWLRNGEREYFMVVNRDPNDDMSFTATFAPGTELVRRDGSRVPAYAYSDTFWLDPGDATIFRCRFSACIEQGDLAY